MLKSIGRKVMVGYLVLIIAMVLAGIMFQLSLLLVVCITFSWFSILPTC